MQVINVIKLERGLIDHIKSFVYVTEDKNITEVVARKSEHKAVEDAESYMREKILELNIPYSQEDLETYIEDGYCENGFEIQIVWSV
jgi:hypothetical protein